MSRVDSHIHGGSGKAYARSSDTRERLCAVYLSTHLSVTGGVDAWGGIEEKGNCIISNLLDQRIVIKVNDAS